MILTDREIQACLKHGQLVIAPPPLLDFYSSTSVDLTLGETIRIWDMTQPDGVEPPILSPAENKFVYKKVAEKYAAEIILPNDGRILEPGCFLLAWSKQSIIIPNESRLAARVEGKSSLARLGLAVHLTAPTIHAGFEGNIQLELVNLGRCQIRIKSGMRICQLIFEMVAGMPEKAYAGQFQKQFQK